MAYYYETEFDEPIVCPVCLQGRIIIAEDLSILVCDTCESDCSLGFSEYGEFECRGLIEQDGELFVIKEIEDEKGN